jgi:tRNA(Arg) A34 adenosine deaminase TadA
MPTKPDDEIFLRRAIAVAATARAHGNQPFGAILVDPDGTILLEAATGSASAASSTASPSVTFWR